MLNKTPNSTPLYPKAIAIDAVIAGIMSNLPAATKIKYLMFFHILFISISPPRIISAMGDAVLAISAIVLSKAAGSFISNTDTKIPKRDPIINGFVKILIVVFL